MEACGSFSPQWQKLGTALDLPESELDAIGQAREKDEASCMEELLKVGTIELHTFTVTEHSICLAVLVDQS